MLQKYIPPSSKILIKNITERKKNPSTAHNTTRKLHGNWTNDDDVTIRRLAVREKETDHTAAVPLSEV